MARAPERVLAPRNAATLIQALYRSHKARAKLKQQQAAATRIQKAIRGFLDRKRVAGIRRERDRILRFQNVMARNEERARLRVKEMHALRAVPAAELPKYEERRSKAAIRIQAVWKGHRARNELYRRRPELDARHAAAICIQQAFRRSASSPLRASVRESARDPFDLLWPDEAAQVDGQVSPSKAAAHSSLAGLSLPERGEDGKLVMSDTRRAQLMKQVEQKVEMLQAARQVPSLDEDSRQLDKKCRELLEERRRDSDRRWLEMHERAHIRSQAAIAFSSLQKKHLELKAIPATAEPHNFVLPPRDSLRMARARHGHAAMLAQEKAGAHWWKHLHALNEHEEELDDSWTVWDEMDNTRAARWARVLYEEQIRKDITNSPTA